MSRNISLLSGKKDDKNSLFGKISVSPNETTDAQLAGEYNLGVSTIHSTKSFYDFLSEDFKNKKAYVCTGSACMCRGTQDNVNQKLKSKLGEDSVGEMICLGRCYENSAFYYNGENYSGDDINQLEENTDSTPDGDTSVDFFLQEAGNILADLIKFSSNQIEQSASSELALKNSPTFQKP